MEGQRSSHQSPSAATLGTVPLQIWRTSPPVCLR